MQELLELMDYQMIDAHLIDVLVYAIWTRDGIPAVRVAMETGFTDQSHLTRHFKRAFGVTPGQYARGGTG
jgi:AraC-like DNA-binding protein